MTFDSIKITLSELQKAIEPLQPDDFKKPIATLSGSSIGEHCRHIIELFQCALTAYETGLLNYDNRDRNLLLQTNKTLALKTIQQLISAVEKTNKNIVLEHRIAGTMVLIETNYFREMLYNFEHCIHHQALIKVAMMQFTYIEIHENFGVAPSTIAYRKQCAQ